VSAGDQVTLACSHARHESSERERARPPLDASGKWARTRTRALLVLTWLLQPARGAGNNPGLGSANRGFSFQQNDNPNTPFVSARLALHLYYGPLIPVTSVLCF
jgi:hypothetical protein